MKRENFTVGMNGSPNGAINASRNTDASHGGSGSEYYLSDDGLVIGQFTSLEEQREFLELVEQTPEEFIQFCKDLNAGKVTLDTSWIE